MFARSLKMSTRKFWQAVLLATVCSFGTATAQQPEYSASTSWQAVDDKHARHQSIFLHDCERF